MSEVRAERTIDVAEHQGDVDQVTRELVEQLKAEAKEDGLQIVGDVQLFLTRDDTLTANEVLIRATAQAEPYVYRPRVLVDFDGVIHWYRKGWQDGSVYDIPVPGALDTLTELAALGYELVVFSTRSADQIVPWLAANGFPAWRVTNIKEPAVAYIDDRAIRFVHWSTAKSQLLARYPIKAATP